MTMPRTFAKHRRLLTTALAASAVAAVVLTASGFPDRVGPGSPAAAATATALSPARVWVAHTAETPRPRVDADTGRSGVILYFLMEAARPQPLFAR